MRDRLADLWYRSAEWPLGGQLLAAAIVISVVALAASPLMETETRPSPAAATGATSSSSSSSSTSAPSSAVTPSTTTAADDASVTTVSHSDGAPAVDLAALVVAEPHHAGYDRDLFGGGWVDVDGDCQDTRAEVLIDESVVATSGGCSVASGEWHDPWTGEVFTVARQLDVDHTVPLANAWRSGAWSWPGSQRITFANDLSSPDHLVAMSASANRSKGDGGPEEWRPPVRASWCRYATAWVDIKVRWELTVTQPEFGALEEMVATC